MAYRRDEELKMFFRKFISVGFLPMDEIGGSIVRLLEDQETQRLVRRYIDLQDFLQYFYSTWFRTFPPEMCVFERPSRIRTTNNCEGWNNAWNRRNGRKSPNFWLAIRFLKREERIIRNTIESMEAGAMPPRQRKKWRTLNLQIDALKFSLIAGNRSVMKYWKAVSFVCKGWS